MPNSKYDVRELAKHIAEGRHDQVMRERAAYKTNDPAFPIFLRFVILDVISDPSVIDSTKLAHWEHDLQVSNIHYATVAPRNSIIARRVMSAEGGASDKVMVLYPFFPPHMAFPAKPGEHVWVMFENPDAKINELGYWFCRIVHPNFVEDQNYTHADRQFDASFLPGLSDVFEGTADPKYEFHNGAAAKDTQSGDTYVGGNTPSLPGDDKVYEDLLKNSDAAKTTKYESVPRYRKRPADLAWEGSNNQLIVFGTDRSGPIADYDTDPAQGKIPKPVPDDFSGGPLNKEAGMIDIVVGRGQTPITGGKPELNTLGNQELGKAKPDLADNEGDPDYVQDRSRIMISQTVMVDKRFALKDYNSSTQIDALAKAISDDAGYGAVVIKTDKVRIIARRDVQFIVQGAKDRLDNGNLKDETDTSKWASITIKSNGDIIFSPSATGLVRLGGEDATLSPLCTRVGNVPGMKGPVTPPSPIVDTMGGSQGGADGLNGTFPTKVLLK